MDVQSRRYVADSYDATEPPLKLRNRCETMQLLQPMIISFNSNWLDFETMD